MGGLRRGLEVGGGGLEVLPPPACPLTTLATFRAPRTCQHKPPISNPLKPISHHPHTTGLGRWGWRFAGGWRFHSQLLLHSRAVLLALRTLSQPLLYSEPANEPQNPPTSNPLKPNVPQQPKHVLGEWGWRFAGSWRFRSQLLLHFWSALLSTRALSQLLLHLEPPKRS